MTREIHLSDGRVALVDAADYERVMAAGTWNAVDDTRTTYARKSLRQPDGTYREFRLHTFLTGWPLVDHINGDGLDNRRGNLREATVSENCRNKRVQRNATSGYKGLTYLPTASRHKPWTARIMHEGKRIFLGGFPTPEAAAVAYDQAARELHGEFACVNFPRPGERSARRQEATS